jgi:hypothetical protein
MGPWSWRRFRTEEEARCFHVRLPSGHPDPICLSEDHVAPDGTILLAGSWIVIYRPITF